MSAPCHLPVWLRCILAMLAALASTDALPAADGGLNLELRVSSPAYDPGAAENGEFIATLRNESQAEVTWRGGLYDGRQLLLCGHGGGFSLGMHPARPAASAVPKSVRLPPGGSVVVFRLPLAEALLQSGATDARWRWGWHRAIPRGAPPASPIHSRGRASLGWEVALAPSGRFWAEVEVDGRTVRSETITLPVRALAMEEVEADVRLTFARYLPPERERIEFRFDVRSVRLGSISADERRFVLPVGNGEHLMAATGVRSLPTEYEYDFSPGLARLRFARVRNLPPEGGSRLILLSYPER